MEKPGQLWIPADPRYAIVYEMEYIESSVGYYPSTEAFLQLLSSLMAVGGFPSNVGEHWRTRSGCAPYVEYVVDYVLPRATGHFEHLPALSFRSTEDKYRFLGLALEVVETVLTRYALIPNPTSFPDLPAEKLVDELVKSTHESANEALGHLDLARLTTVRPNVDDAYLLTDDFRSAPIQVPIVKSDLNSTTQFPSTGQPTISRATMPRSKAPGYSIMAEILSPVGCKLFGSLITIVSERHIDSTLMLNSDTLSMAYALYVSTTPTFNSAKEGARRAGPGHSRQSLLKSLYPSTVLSKEINCRELAILRALRIFCAAIAREHLFRRCVSSMPGQTSMVPVLRFATKSHIPVAIDLQLSELTQLLRSSDSDTGIVSSIVGLIGCVSSNERMDTDVAAAAAAILFSIERSLPRQQIFELLNRHCDSQGHGGLARAFTTRLLVASSRPLSQPDVDFLRFVVDRILFELRSESSDGVLTQVIFGRLAAGLDSSVQIGSHGPLEAIVELLGGIDFVFESISAGVASSCYEILYRLTKIKTGDPNNLMSFRTSERLRAFDFWKASLIKICSLLLSAPQSATTSNYHVIHSIAWLLKGVASELNLLAGFSTDVVATSGLERFVTPRPGLYKSLCGALFSDDGLIAQALQALPIERPPVSSIYTTPSDEQAVVEAKEALDGSSDVVHGYYTINLAKLVNFMRAKDLTLQEEGLRFWVEHWNHSILRDCASAHLSDSIYCVVGSATSSVEDAAFQIPTGLFAGKRTMIHILKRMSLPGSTNEKFEVVDDAFFTTACRNLALATRTVSNAVACQHVDNSNSGDDIDTMTVGSLIVRAIACSAVGSQSQSISLRREETIAALAGALVPILRQFPDPDVRDGDRRCFFRTAVILSELAGKVDAEKIPAVPSPETIVLRVCLSVLLGILQSSSKGEAFSSCYAVLTDTSFSGSPNNPVRGMIGLVPMLDENITTILQTLVGLSPDVADLTVASGILEALQDAADLYHVEETRFLASQALNVRYDDVQIQTPSFLIGHFELMGALMASPACRERKLYVAAKVVRVVQTYKSALERLLRDFPTDGHTLLAILRCMAQSSALLHETNCASIGTRTLVEELRSSGTEEVLGTTDMLSRVAKLTMHVAENPLPLSFLGALPSRLYASQSSSGVIGVCGASVKSWWDAPGTGSLANDLIEVAILGIDILRFGFLLIRTSSSAEASPDEFILSRAICRCVSATMVRFIVKTKSTSIASTTHQLCTHCLDPAYRL